MENTEKTTLNDYMKDNQGRLVPIAMVKEIDVARDELVREIVGDATRMSHLLENFKIAAMADVAAFVELSAEKYGVKLGGVKGNTTLTTYDGEYKLQLAVAEHLTFSEQLQAAKALIDDCLHEWTKDSRVELRMLINDAFQVDKQGNINTNRVLGLRRLDIKDPKWQAAMQAIGDSLQVAGSKSYLRIYRRQGDGGYSLVNLDVAKL
jgi:hypothetical protein